MYLLDTNVVITVINGRSRLLSERLKAEMRFGSAILVSTIVLFELRYGIAKSIHGEKSKLALSQFLDGRLSIVPFEAEDAEQAGQIRAHLHGAGTPIGPYDLLIAAQARRHHATLITGNQREFGRVPG